MMVFYEHPPTLSFDCLPVTTLCQNYHLCVGSFKFSRV